MLQEQQTSSLQHEHYLVDCNSIFTIANVMRFKETKSYILGITRLEPSIDSTGSSIPYYIDRKSD